MKVSFGKIALLVSGLMLTGIFFVTCGRHATSYDFMNEPVNGDTVVYVATMDEQLRQDSLEGNDAYYYRINRVKRVEYRDSAGRTRMQKDVDRFGHELYSLQQNSSYRVRSTAVYNRYAHLRFSDRDFDWSDGDGGHYTTRRYEYAQDPDGQSERLIKETYDVTSFGTGTEGPFVLDYEYADGKVSTITEWNGWRCTHRTFFSYNDSGKLLARRELYFEPNYYLDSSATYYRYDSLGRVTSVASMENGVLVDDELRTWSTQNRLLTDRRISYKYGYDSVTEYYYSGNGLLQSTIRRSEGSIPEVEYCVYAFY